MPTECSAKPMGFARVDSRAVVADFDGGEITSNAGGLLLGATDRAIGLVERFAACFTDGRAAERVVHEVTTLVGRSSFDVRCTLSFMPGVYLPEAMRTKAMRSR